MGWTELGPWVEMHALPEELGWTSAFPRAFGDPCRLSPGGLIPSGGTRRTSRVPGFLSQKPLACVGWPDGSLDARSLSVIDSLLGYW